MTAAKTEWYKDFFHGIALDLWRQVVNEEQTRAEADFIQDHLKLPPSARILDVPCGNGRISHEMAKRGYRMTGVDIAFEFIQEARTKASEGNLSIAWECHDMKELSWDTEFDGAFCFGNSFGYFDDEGNHTFLKSVGRSLKPGARFIIDCPMVAESFLPRFQAQRSYQAGDIRFETSHTYDHVRSRLETEYTFVRDGVAEKRVGSHRVYTYRELCRLLNDAGFCDCRGYGSTKAEPFKLGAPRVLLLATRN